MNPTQEAIMFPSHQITPTARNLFIGAVLALCAGVNARAQSAEVFVSARTGVDGGSCTSALPCRTVTHALTQVQSHGLVLIVDSGDYDDSITIAKSVTIAASPGVTAVFTQAVQFGSMVSATNGPTTCLSFDLCYTVVLRNLTFDGQSVTQDAIRTARMAVTVEDCRFSRFRFGIYANGAAPLRVKRSSFRGGEQGMLIAPNGTGKMLPVVVEDSHFEAMSFAAINADTNGSNTLRLSILRSSFQATGFWGLRSVAASGGGVQANVEETHIVNCTTGLVSSGGGSIVRVTNSTIVNNTTGLLASLGGSLLSRGNNTVEGNNTNGSFTGAFSAK
jgi:hypothetical protein